MTYSEVTLYAVRCDGKLRAACHDDHPCPATLTANSREVLAEMLEIGRWLTADAPPDFVQLTAHYCPSHRDSIAARRD